MGLALLVSAGWFVAILVLTPASSRPYIGGSQNNSFWNVLFGYNGFGRLSGNETGSVGGGAQGTTGRWGPTGLTRMFKSSFGDGAVVAPPHRAVPAGGRPRDHDPGRAHRSDARRTRRVGRLAPRHRAGVQPR